MIYVDSAGLFCHIMIQAVYDQSSYDSCTLCLLFVSVVNCLQLYFKLGAVSTFD
jgi:hypothetical protein